jgi:hypothetical protein
MALYQEAGQSVVAPQILEGYLFGKASEFDLAPPPSSMEVTAAIELLANPMINILQNIGDGSYALTMAPEIAADLFRLAVELPERQGEDASLESAE